MPPAASRDGCRTGEREEARAAESNRAPTVSRRDNRPQVEVPARPVAAALERIPPE